ncbi:hypothetical protein [Cupriavidus pauculus]|uniref:hypothetical protein n=1 Tax=Cupriavidus pauculus TaxID=82633 RepID=UPI001EE173A3|nr:hypothetical protein [Cupriavidus pauculus]GJG94376.1 hypothetical protein CBA19C6_07825 [Cupriavidus pauculus]
MTQDAGIAEYLAAEADADGASPALLALRQWRDLLLERLERLERVKRHAAHALIHDRHGLLLELARCALDLREAAAVPWARVCHPPPFTGGERALPALYAAPGKRPAPSPPDPVFPAECAAVSPRTATVRLDFKPSPPWQTSIPHFLPSNRS